VATRKTRCALPADDFSGATDLANNLARGGMRVVQTTAELPLLTAGSGIAIELPQNFDLREGGAAAARLPAVFRLLPMSDGGRP
jgi:uncharacterized protein YgbK (DUF1537 family)